MADHPSIGRREYGQSVRRERWYHCAIMDEVVPESETVVPTWPHPHAGMRVCLKHLDENDFEMNRILNPPRIPPEEENP
jgi:hypothetical protein